MKTMEVIHPSFRLSIVVARSSSLSVLDAIDPTEGWESNDTMHLISLRGSKLLASSSSGGNYATATREFERQFQIASILCSVVTEDKRG